MVSKEINQSKTKKNKHFPKSFCFWTFPHISQWSM